MRLGREGTGADVRNPDLNGTQTLPTQTTAMGLYLFA